MNEWGVTEHDRVTMTFADRTNAERLAAKPGRMLMRWVFGAWQPIESTTINNA